jgi:cation:H+ antiporter
MITINFFLIVLGFALMIKGGIWLVEGASTLAHRWGASDLLIGLTVVSMGTSAPELLVNLAAAWNQNTDLALANIVGSCIANVLLILGAAALVAPLAVAPSTVFKEIPFCLLASVIVGVVANDTLIDGGTVSAITCIDGIVLLGFFAVFLYYLASLKSSHTEAPRTSQAGGIKAPRLSPVAALVLGLTALIAGGETTVQSATALARNLGVTERIIGLTILAIGTSLPELLTSLVAAFKGKIDMSIGNVVGSNIFNLFWILGISSVVTPLPVSAALNRDIAVMVAAIILLLFLIQPGSFANRLRFWRIQRGHVLARWEGGALVLTYLLYIGLVVAWQ